MHALSELLNGNGSEKMAPQILIKSTISLEMPVPSQDHCGFSISQLLTDFVCLLIDEFWISVFFLQLTLYMDYIFVRAEGCDTCCVKQCLPVYIPHA